MKNNKQKPHLKWNQEARRGSSHALPLYVNCRPQGEEIPLHLQQKEYYYFTTQQEERRVSLCLATAQPMRGCHKSANEKSLYFEFPVSSNGLFVYNGPGQLLLLYKRLFLSSVLWTYLWVTISFRSQIAILCCSQINPFCWQNNWLFYINKSNKAFVLTSRLQKYRG